MKNYRTSRASNVVTLTLSAVALIFLSASQLQAQGTPQSPNSPNREPSTPAIQPRHLPTAPSVREREYTLRRMEEDAKKVPTAAETKLAMEQVAEDYQRIQVINNKMMSAATSGKPLDYAGIAEVTSEIRKRALRLKTNIALPKPEDADKKLKDQVGESDAQIKDSLRVLDRFIMSFVKSPIFKNPDLVDAKIASKASHDLESVIELSQLINKNAEKLGKSTKKP
jgi:hypothetical protein